jgi:hypothetical protein
MEKDLLNLKTIEETIKIKKKTSVSYINKTIKPSISKI